MTFLGFPTVFLPSATANERSKSGAKELHADLVVIGGSLGGCAAALAAARNGRSVIMTEETDWIGGQLTAQAVPPDENRWVESYGATRSYRDLRERIRDYYRRNYPLTDEARAKPNLNPGNGHVSRLCHEPRVALAALQEMLAPFISDGRVSILLHHVPVLADVDGDRVAAVAVRSLLEGHETVLSAPYFIDATELGDLLPLAKVEYVTGFESQKETGEPGAPDEAQPQNMQAITWCFAVSHHPRGNHVIDKPRDYAFWRDYVPEIDPPWPGKLLSFEMSHPHTLEVRPMSFNPEGSVPEGLRNLWLFRRITDKTNFLPGTITSDISLINWPENDYLLGNICEVSEDEAAKHREQAKQLSLSLVYWLQTEAPRPDGGTGWPGLKLRGDITGSEDGLAKYPYIRESRRIRAEFTILQQHVGTRSRMEITGLPEDEVKAEQFPDSVGIGYYRIDLHPTTGGDNYFDVPAIPFQIPLGSLIPQRVENLLPACKNIGTTHITNGCYRLHPVEWNIGEAAGMLAHFSLDRKEPPRRIRNHPPLLQDFQALLENEGITLSWPEA